MKPTHYTGPPSQEYLEPTLCFSRTRLKIDENYPLEKLPVTEPVQKGQLLLEFTDSGFPGNEKLPLRPVIAGLNTVFSEDRTQLLSEVTGYPEIAFHTDPDSEEKHLVVTVEPLFRLSRDRMEALIIIRPLLFKCTYLTSENLYQLLSSSGIVWGIDYKQLNLTKEIIRKGPCVHEPVVLARGKKPEDGKNAYLKFHLEIGPIAGTLLPDGSIDFRERKIMVPVSAGQLIATKVPLTKGRPGMTVEGEPIAQRIGLDIEVKTSGEVEYLPDTNQIRATGDGVLSVVHDNVIKVCSKQEIHSDIDYSTGNIESRNSVVIHGSVLPCFKVKTDGDLEINGNVTSTQVSSLSNIVIKGGIFGNGSSLKAEGDADIFFIEQGHIQCGGNCVIRKQCYYSYISVGGDIRCKDHSVVVGGELVAAGSITLGDAGAADSDPGFIAAGVVAERLYQSRKLQKRMTDYQESIIQRLKGYTGAARTKKLHSIRGRIEEIKFQYLHINMIPGTALYSRPEEKTDSSAESPPSAAKEQKQSIDISKITIDAYGTIQAGTILQIGNRMMKVDETISKQRFQLDESQTHILALPLRYR